MLSYSGSWRKSGEIPLTGNVDRKKEQKQGLTESRRLVAYGNEDELFFVWIDLGGIGFDLGLREYDRRTS